MRLLAYDWWRGHRMGWVRLFATGWGLHVQDHRITPPLFSERNGYTRGLHLGSWCFKVLRPYRLEPPAQREPQEAEEGK